MALSRSEDGVHVSLTHSPLDITKTIDLIRSPLAGAIVLFAGTTREDYNMEQNTRTAALTYSAYAALALRSLLQIGHSCKKNFGLTGIAIVHRLGRVSLGEESILVAVSASHRKEAWRAGEEALEECKAKVEIWKKDEMTFINGKDEENEQVIREEWKANETSIVGTNRKATRRDVSWEDV
ncbi:MAG: hypothetical protein M1823_006022 [Watsoniomyces obsoletus]|nr:MAG: hypothetical protein M1823_006022 [Watsoniomyces obsoletus]